MRSPRTHETVAIDVLKDPQATAVAKASAANSLQHTNLFPTGYTPWRDRPLLQLKVASEIAGVSPASLYRFSDQGKLKLRELGGRTLVDVKSLIALIDGAHDWKPKNRGEEARAKRKEIARTSARR